jgi:hypothetical protein
VQRYLLYIHQMFPTPESSCRCADSRKVCTKASSSTFIGCTNLKSMTESDDTFEPNVSVAGSVLLCFCFFLPLTVAA